VTAGAALDPDDDFIDEHDQTVWVQQGHVNVAFERGLAMA
jgi:predicted nucleotide-binding protein